MSVFSSALFYFGYTFLSEKCGNLSFFSWCCFDRFIFNEKFHDLFCSNGLRRSDDRISFYEKSVQETDGRFLAWIYPGVYSVRSD